jgi:hypothetical protein
MRVFVSSPRTCVTVCCTPRFSMTTTRCMTGRYIGLDLSTQQLKAVVTDEHLNVVHTDGVVFETDLAEYKCADSVCACAHTRIVQHTRRRTRARRGGHIADTHVGARDRHALRAATCIRRFVANTRHIWRRAGARARASFPPT